MRKWWALTVISLGLLVAAGSAAAKVKTYLPQKTTDHAPNGCKPSDCTLREAVIAANHHPGRDTISLEKKAYKLQIAPSGPDDELTGDLNITDPVVIAHKGRGLATIDANHVDRAIMQTAATQPEHYTKLSRIAIVNGHTTDRGGGIEIGVGLLGLDHSRVSHNSATFDGGGIYATSGELTLKDSTVSDNRAGGIGGGVYTAVPTEVGDSTISGNLASSAGPTGGGGLVSLDDLSMTNSTVAKNKATAEGGGLELFGSSELSNVTVTANRSNSDGVGGDPGGGVAVGPTPPVIANSIIDGNSSGPGGSEPDCGGTFLSAGHNLVNQTAGCSGFGSKGDILDPKARLRPLADNGGPTQTVALKAGSPAIGHASRKTSEKRDQRGYRRDKHPDIGAYERGAKP
jgi:predicted outer membrane repeat protein